MKINSTDNTNFQAKLIRTQTLDEAVSGAKNFYNNGKYAFFNSIDILHNESGFKTFKIEKIQTVNPELRQQFKLQAKKDNGDVFEYVTPIINNEDEDQNAAKAIIDFISKYYGKRTAQYVKLSRKCSPVELNERIDGILFRNSVL